MILKWINNRILHTYIHTHTYTQVLYYNNKENDEPIIPTEYDPYNIVSYGQKQLRYSNHDW